MKRCFKVVVVKNCDIFAFCANPAIFSKFLIFAKQFLLINNNDCHV